MPEQSSSPSHKLSAFLARKIVWLWPEETKEWALAFEAELPEIATPLASVRWVIGGVALLARESLRHFLKSLWRPLGIAAPSESPAFAGNGGPAPRLPRVFTAFFLAASLSMLCLPEVRGSLGSSVFFGQTKIHEYFQERNFQKLRDHARANHDPQLLAFLSLALSSSNERYSLADEAIRRDPSLTWVDYYAAWWFWNDTDRSHFLSDERIRRLQAFDPQNAAPLLLTAEAISHPVKVAAYFSTSQSTPLGEAPPWERAITKNAAWLAAMERAFEAPQFHDYYPQRVALVSQVCNRYRISDPDLLQYLSFSYGPTMGISTNVEAYSRFLTERGDNEAAKGDWALATKDYAKAEQFAEKVQDGIKSRWGLWWAAKIGGPAAKKLQTALEASGHPLEAQIAAAKFAAWKKTSGRFEALWGQRLWATRGRKPWSKTEEAGLLINLAVLLIAFFLPLTMVALVCVGVVARYSRQFLGRFYQLVCVAADAAPIVLALSFALLFFAYHPYSHPFQNAASRDELMEVTSVAHNLPESVGLVYFDIFQIHGRYYFWVGLTSALSLIALFLLYRMTLKKRRS